MLHGETLQFRFSVGGEADEDLPAVNCTLFAAHEPLDLGAVNEAHHAMLLHLKSLSKRRDGGLLPVWKTSNSEQELMLLWRDTFAARGALAEAQEAAKAVAKCGNCLKIGFAE